MVLVLLAKAFNINALNIQPQAIIELGFLVLYLSAIAIIAGIDLEKRKIEKSVIYYAIGIMVLYIIYLCIVDKANIYRYIMYLSITLVLIIIDTINLKKHAKTSYILSFLILILVMAVFTGELITFLSLVMTLLIIGLYIIFSIIRNKRSKIVKNDKKVCENLSFGFYLATSNIIMLIYVLYIFIKFV